MFSLMLGTHDYILVVDGGSGKFEHIQIFSNNAFNLLKKNIILTT